MVNNSKEDEVNPAVLEERCVRLQIPSLASKKTCSSSSSFHSSQAIFRSIIAFPDSKVTFFKEVLRLRSPKVPKFHDESDEDSFVCVSSNDEPGILAFNSMPKGVQLEDVLGEVVVALFQSSTNNKFRQKPSELFSPISPSQFPPKFSSLIEKCGMVLGKISSSS